MVSLSRTTQRSALVALLLAFVAASCGGTATGSLPPASGTPVTEAPYPRTVTDDAGSRVTIPAEPQQIVALTPASLETLAELNLADHVVGRADCPCTPPELESVPIVADYVETNVEAILEMSPDLVFAGGSDFTPAEVIAALQGAGVPVVVVDPKGIDGVLASLQLVGDAAGRSVAAATLVAGIRSDLDALAAAVQGAVRPRVFYEIDATGAIYGLAPDDYAVELVERAGGEPVTSGANGVYEIGLEALITAQPEVILLGDAAYGTTAEAVAARPGWEALPAVGNGKILPIDGDLVSTPGPRIAEALRALIAAIHPEIQLPQ